LASSSWGIKNLLLKACPCFRSVSLNFLVPYMKRKGKQVKNTARKQRNFQMEGDLKEKKKQVDVIRISAVFF